MGAQSPQGSRRDASAPRPLLRLPVPVLDAVAVEAVGDGDRRMFGELATTTGPSICNRSGSALLLHYAERRCVLRLEVRAGHTLLRAVRMSETTLLAEVSGGSLRVRVAGPPEGTRMLFLHGGPGLSDSSLDELLGEFSDTYRVATYAQRGVAPSEAEEPFDLPVQVADVVAVLDALGWPDAVVVGHSWGGHLLLHLLAARTGRVRAAVAIETLGAVGDGQAESFAEELLHRLTPEARARGEQPDLSDDEQFAVNWPGYFPPDTPVPPLRPMASHPKTFDAGAEAMFAALPALAGRLEGVTTPTLFITGLGSPMPEAAAAETAALLACPVVSDQIPGGHFPWLVSPGAIRAAVDEFLSALP